MTDKFYSLTMEDLNSKIAELQEKNHFALLWDLRETFSPKELPSKLGWTRISTKGDLPLCDYNCGLFCVSVELYGQGYQIDGKYAGVNYYVHFHVGNADDMSWDAWSKPYDTKEECLQQVYKTAKVLDDLVSMPSEEHLNEMLAPYGLYGQLEG